MNSKEWLGHLIWFWIHYQKEQILFAISNQVNSIDLATLRRFNVNIKMNNISLEIFEKELFSLAILNKFNFEKETCHKILV